MAGAPWLTARPIAHRGLHGADTGAVENSLSAATAAVEGGYAIEVDLQLSADGVPMVFHDGTLDRMTNADGPLRARTAEELAAVTLRGTSEAIPTLAALLATVAGRTPLVLELKTEWQRARDPELPRRTAEALAGYAGPVALMSFDPDMVAASRGLMPDRPHGIVARDSSNVRDFPRLSVMERFALTHLLHAPRTRPDFVAYRIHDLPTLSTSLLRRLFGVALLTWTVRSQTERQKAARVADQIIFEGFRA
ncbi:glycerophosphoryl diester phosphodiesterase [Amorphus suaedae]